MTKKPENHPKDALFHEFELARWEGEGGYCPKCEAGGVTEKAKRPDFDENKGEETNRA